MGILEYVVCHSIYEYEDCVLMLPNGHKQSKLCCFIKYLNHPHLSKRQPCNSTLLKTVNNKLVPVLTYPYFPLLRQLVSKPNFLKLCEKWRHRESTIPTEILADIYDGFVWNSFRSNFLSAPYSLLLSLNVDWFQPFKHIQYSVGCIYLVIRNLPREEQYKLENVILVGLMPGPHESSFLPIDY